MRDFENSFDAALAGVDRTIVEVKCWHVKVICLIL